MSAVAGVYMWRRINNEELKHRMLADENWAEFTKGCD